MAKGKSKKEGFQSAAGLIRYFDSEEQTAFQISPKVVLALILITAVIVVALKYIYPA